MIFDTLKTISGIHTFQYNGFTKLLSHVSMLKDLIQEKQNKKLDKKIKLGLLTNENTSYHLWWCSNMDC